jgi:hypothetical protein
MTVNEYNPYAPPASDHQQWGHGAPPNADATGCWRDGDTVVMMKNHSRLPDRCVICNQPAHGYRLKKTLYWHDPLVYLALLAGVLIYAIIALVSRKSAYVELGLCPAHKQRRIIGIAVAIGGFCLFFVLMLVGASNNSSELLLGSLVLMLILPIVGLILARTAQPKRIDDHYAWLKVGRPFLETFTYGQPQAQAWPGQRQGW